MVRVYLLLEICLVLVVGSASGSAETECMNAKAQVLASYNLIVSKWSTDDSQFASAVKELGTMLSNLRNSLISCPVVFTALKLDSPLSSSAETYPFESLDLSVLDQAKATLDALAVEQKGTQVLLQGIDISSQIADNPLPELPQDNTQNCSAACQEDLYEIFKRATDLVMDAAVLPQDMFGDMLSMVVDGYFAIKDCSGCLF